MIEKILSVVIKNQNRNVVQRSLFSPAFVRYVKWIRSAFFCALLFCSVSCGKQETASFSIPEDAQKKAMGPLEISAWLDQKKISLAETAVFNLHLRIKKEYVPEIKADALLSDENFILRDADEQTDTDPEYIWYRHAYTVEPNFSGDLTIPEITIEFKKPDEEQDYRLTTDPLTLTVTGLSEEEQKNLTIEDIEGPKELEKEPFPLWIIAAAGGGAAVCAAAVFVLMKRKKQNAAIAVPPFQRALAKLKELAGKEYIEQGMFETFYYEITWIIRVFISEEFGIDAPESTTEEFLADMEKNPEFPKKFKPELREYLDHCDMVKYAAVIPGKPEIQKVFDVTKEFIITAGKTDGES